MTLEELDRQIDELSRQVKILQKEVKKMLLHASQLNQLSFDFWNQDKEDVK